MNTINQIPITILSSQFKEMRSEDKIVLVLNTKKEKFQFKEIIKSNNNDSKLKAKLILEIDALSLIYLGKEKIGLIKKEEILVIDFNSGEKLEDIDDSDIKEIKIRPINIKDISISKLDEFIINFVKNVVEQRKTRKEKLPYNLLDLRQFQEAANNFVSFSTSEISKVVDLGFKSVKNITETGVKTIDSGVKLVFPKKQKSIIEDSQTKIPMEDVVEISGKKWRKKEVLMFIPGPGESSSTFKEILILSSENYRSITYDLPGMPKNPISPKKINLNSIIDNIHEAITYSGKKDIILVSHSLGGYFLLKYADKYPELIKGIILISYPGELDNNFKKLLSLVPPKFLWHPLKGKAIKAGMNVLFENNEIQQAKELVDDFKSIPDGVTQKYIKILNSDGESLINKTSKPVFILMGRKDIVFQDFRSSITNKDNISLKWIQNGKHMMHIERSSEIQIKIEDWCNNL